MAVIFAQANSQQSLSSQTFVDVPDAAVTTTATGDWAIFFSAVLQPDQGCTVEFQIVSDGHVVPNSRVLKVDIFGAKIERVFTLEGKAAPGSGKVIKLQWRATYGQIKIGDRRLMIVQ